MARAKASHANSTTNARAVLSSTLASRTGEWIRLISGVPPGGVAPKRERRRRPRRPTAAGRRTGGPLHGGRAGASAGARDTVAAAGTLSQGWRSRREDQLRSSSAEE